MERSFGAPFFYIPKKYTRGRGKAPKEPADLAWIKDDLTVLFYLHRSNTNTIEKQINHNIRQANGFVGQWKRNETTLPLKAQNSFGKTETKYFEDTKQLIIVSVISANCGVSIVQTDSKDKYTKHLTDQLVINMPETLIEKLADLGGTIVDMLKIIKVYLTIWPEKDIPPDIGKQLLLECLQRYEQNAVNALLNKEIKITPITDDYTPTMEAKALRIMCIPKNNQQYQTIRNTLSTMKHRSNYKDVADKKAHREIVTNFFSDLSLAELVELVERSAQVIQMSQPPTFETSHIMRFEHYYNFVVACLNTADQDFMAKGIEIDSIASNNNSEPDAVVVTYANVMNANDYNVPLLFQIPEYPKDSQASALAQEITALSSP